MTNITHSFDTSTVHLSASLPDARVFEYTWTYWPESDPLNTASSMPSLNSSITLPRLSAGDAFRVQVSLQATAASNTNINLCASRLSDTFRVPMPETLPSGPPQNLVTRLLPFAVTFTWQAPELDKRNGMIVGYHVVVERVPGQPLANPAHPNIQQFSVSAPADPSSAVSFTLTQFDNAVEYVFTFAAINSAGTSPVVATVAIETLAAGEIVSVSE